MHKFPFTFWARIACLFVVGLGLNLAVNAVVSLVITIPVALLCALVALAVAGDPLTVAVAGLIIAHAVSMIVSVSTYLGKLGEAIEAEKREFLLLEKLEGRD